MALLMPDERAALVQEFQPIGHVHASLISRQGSRRSSPDGLLSAADLSGPRSPAIAVPESLPNQETAIVAIVRNISGRVPIAVTADTCRAPPVWPMPTIGRPPPATPTHAMISAAVEATSRCNGRRYESDWDDRKQGYQRFTHRGSLPFQR